MPQPVFRHLLQILHLRFLLFVVGPGLLDVIGVIESVLVKLLTSLLPPQGPILSARLFNLRSTTSWCWLVVKKFTGKVD